MWTYVMATSRGDRGNFTVSRRQRELDLPQYSYNRSRPMYRSTARNERSMKHSSITFGTSYSFVNTPNKLLRESSNTEKKYMQLGNQKRGQDIQKQHQYHIVGYDNDYSTNVDQSNHDNCDMEDISLFSPLTPSCPAMAPDNAVFLARKQLLINFEKQTAAFQEDNYNTKSFQSSNNTHSSVSAAISLPTQTSDIDDTYEHIVNSSGRQLKYSSTPVQCESAKIISHSKHEAEVIHDEDDSKNDDILNDDIEETTYNNNDQANAERLSLDQMKRTKSSTLRRTINALRQHFTKKGNRSKTSDWFLEHFPPTGTQSDKFTEAPVLTTTTTTITNINNNSKKKVSVNAVASDTGPAHEIHGSNRFCNYLSVDPSLQSHYRWLAVVSLAVLYNIIFVMGRAVFWEINRKATFVWYILDYCCDFIYVADILVHMHEGYLDQGLLVRDAYKLRRHYFTTKGWCLDILSIAPTDLLYIRWSPSQCGPNFLPCAVIVRLNRLLRLPRMWEWFDRTETATGYPNVFRICKVLLAILVLIHWNACMYFAISFSLGFGTDNWVYNLNGPRNNTLQRQYIYSFYWSTLTLTTIGETPTPENDAEYLFVVLDFLAGVLIFATIVGNIGSMISNMNVARVEFQNRMDGVKQYMAFRKVGHELEARVIRWFAYTWSQSGALDEERVLAALPDKLKAEIAIQVHMDTLKQVRIFHDCEPGLLEALVLKLKLQVFSPGDYICRKGDVGKEMYIVKRGKLSVVADDGVTVFATLGAGSVFGEVSVLEIAGNRTGNRRTANVRSLGYSDLFCLAKRDLWETLADYPEARATLTERGCQLLRKDGLLDEQMFADSQQIQDSIEGGIEKLEESVESLNMRLARLMGEYTASQAKLKQRLAKLELNYYLMHASLTEQHAHPPRIGRLYSVQVKRKLKSRPNNSINSLKDRKQHTL